MTIPSNIREALTELCGYFFIAISICFVSYGAWCWAQDTMTVRDALVIKDIAVLQEKTIAVERRITTVEDRLFGVLLATIGTVIASGTASVFSIKTNRRLKNNGK